MSGSSGINMVDLVEDNPDERRRALQIQQPGMGSVGHGLVQRYLGFYFFCFTRLIYRGGH